MSTLQEEASKAYSLGAAILDIADMTTQIHCNTQLMTEVIPIPSQHALYFFFFFFEEQ
jgi:hypothetical protein